MSQDLLPIIVKLIHSDGDDIRLLDKLCRSWDTLEAGDGVSNLALITSCFLSHALSDEGLQSAVQSERQLLPRILSFVISNLRTGVSCHLSSSDVSHIAEIIEKLLKFEGDYAETWKACAELVSAISTCLEQLFTADLDSHPVVLDLSIATLPPLVKTFSDISFDECYSHILRLLVFRKSHHITKHILTRFLPTISGSGGFEHFIDRAFSFTLSFFSSLSLNDQIEACPHVHVIFTSLIEYVNFTFGKPSSPLTSEVFWSVVQSGLISSDSLTRKRAMYVVRNILGHCASSELEVRGKRFNCVQKNLLESWGTIMTVLEVLEEKQPHAVKPALAKFCTLLEHYNPSEQIHITWILTIFHRMFLHESRTVVKWALVKFMNTESVVKLTLKENENEFLCGSLVDVLNKPGLFAREEGEPLGSPVMLAKCLLDFLQFCEAQLAADHFGAFLLDLLAAVAKQTWNGVSLVYVSYALSHLQAAPILNGSMLHSIGNMLTNIQRFQEPILRAAVQCYWLDISLRLIDPGRVTFDELSAFLSVFKQDDTLKRGTLQWSRTARKIGELNNVQAVDFVRESVQEIVNCDADWTKQGISRVARMAVMLHDCGVVADLSQWKELLGEAVGILSSAARRPYLSLNRRQAAIALFLALQDEATSLLNDSFQCELIDLLCPWAEEMYEHVYSSAFVPLTNINDFQASVACFRFLDVISTRPVFKHFLYTLVKEGLHRCIILLEENSVGNTLSAWRFLSWTVKHFPEKKLEVKKIVMTVIVSGALGQPLERPSEWNIQDPISKAQWVAIETSIMELMWGTIERTAICEMHSEVVIAKALETLQISTQESSLQVLKAIASVTSKLKEGTDDLLLLRCFEMCWQTCKDLKKSSLFRPGIETFVAIAFQPQFLRFTLKAHLMQIAADIQELGEAVPGVFNILMKNLLSIWRDPDNQDLLEDCSTTLIKALTYGVIYRKDQRCVFETEAFIASQGDTLAVNQLLNSEHRVDAEVRIRAITFLVHLNPAAHRGLAAQLCQALLAYDKEVSSVRKRYFGNSSVHRTKNRIWQAILCLQHLLHEEAAGNLLEAVYTSLADESQQPSVRTLLEFTAVRILLRYHQLHVTLIPAMQKASDKRVGSICSFVAIIVHLCASLGQEHVETLLLKFLPELLPWSMGQHFNARVYAQVALSMAARWSTQFAFEKVQEIYCSVFLAMEKDIGNWSKQVQKLLDDFYFSAFNARKHWTAEAIFYDLPRLTGLTDQELVPVQVIEGLMLEGHAGAFLPVRNPDDALKASCPSFWTHGEQEEVGISEEGDFQKKITPWKECLSAEHSKRQSPSSRKGEIIVVASLIDRIPNLGGLCRTCEAFGAHTLVLSSLKHTEDRQFQNLSVSSEMWLDVEEVKAHLLKEYLPQKKDEGYTLVGLEQTAASVPLQEYKFPTKSLLLLGNEKGGLPVELIQLLDVCVEIPQQGVVRSLNVHVSGAIAIWEYTKQQLS